MSKSQPAAPAVGDAHGRVQRDRLPDPVDVRGRDAVLGQHRRGQVRALHLEPGLARPKAAQGQVVQHAGGEQQILVVGRVVQGTFLLGDQAGEQEAADAVLGDLSADRLPYQRKARVGQRPGGQGECVVHASNRRSRSNHRTVARVPSTAMIGP